MYIVCISSQAFLSELGIFICQMTLCAFNQIICTNIVVKINTLCYTQEHTLLLISCLAIQLIKSPSLDPIYLSVLSPCYLSLCYFVLSLKYIVALGADHGGGGYGFL